MAKGKANKGTAEQVVPAGSKAYRNTRTGAVRFSSSKLGYPFEEVDTKVAKAEAKEEAEG